MMHRRPISRWRHIRPRCTRAGLICNSDTFGYNDRSEVVFSRRGAENAEDSYAYDDIGNIISATTSNGEYGYIANNLNQYAEIREISALSQPLAAPSGFASLRRPDCCRNGCISPLCETSYDPDGNMTRHGEWIYAYDAANRLSSVSLSGILLVSNFYDAKSRRVRKVTPAATHSFFYDDWNLIEERVAYTNGTYSTIHYYWGKDLFGTLQGAGNAPVAVGDQVGRMSEANKPRSGRKSPRVGGLLYLTVDGAPYVPFYDNNGNITRYLDANGNTVAQYTYDAFGNTISQSGPLAGFFRHRFSTKYFDAETGLYYYGYRFYHPILMRWLTRDPIGEQGGINLYVFSQNAPSVFFDSIGLTVVRINVGTEEMDSPRGFLNFIKIEATVVEPPKGSGKLNFIQLKKSINSDWELDIQGTPGPYSGQTHLNKFAE